jgi:hypothetical protein
MIHLLISIFLVVLFIRIILRLIFRPFGCRHRYGRYYRGFGGYGGYNDGYNNPYGYGYRRRGFGSIAPIFLLVALDRLFGRRW